MLTLNFFFLPPVGTFTIADPQNWIALFAFLVVAVIASNLSAAAQDRARDAIARRNEVTRLFDLTRDVLLTTETAGAIEVLARHVARRFELPASPICLPGDHGWRIHQGGQRGARRRRRHAEHARWPRRAARWSSMPVSAPTAGTCASASSSERRRSCRCGTARRPSACWPPRRRPLDIGTLDAVAGVVAIAIERAQFLGERDAAALVRQKADLAATLLASLSHDLRTPLTADPRRRREPARRPAGATSGARRRAPR